MVFSGIRFALQQVGPAGGATLTLNTWGVVGLLALLAGSAAGWIAYLVARRQVRAPGSGLPEPRVQAASPPPPPDPLESLFSRTIDAGVDGVLLCREGRVSRSHSRRGLFPVEPGELEGRAVTGLVAAEDVLPVAERLHEITSGEGPATPREDRLRFALESSSSGGSRHVAARILRTPGAPSGDFVMVLSDQTEATDLARAASTVASRVTHALEQVPYAVFLTVVDGELEHVSLANSAAGDLLRLDPASLAGLELGELRDRASAVFSRETALKLFPEAGVPVQERVEVEGDDQRHLECTVRDLATESGHGGRLIIIRDVTESSVREAELRRAEGEARRAWSSIEQRQEQILMANEGLERRIADFTRFNRELKDIDEMKSNFLANVSHELQTPLVSIKGYTEMVLKGRMGPLTDEQERGLKVSLRNVDRLIGLIDSLLSFVRTEKDSEPLRVEAFSLKGMVKEVVELLQGRADQRGIVLETAFPSGDLAVRADRSRISQVFINLISNAIKYNRDGGRVEVEASRGSRANARVEIRDTGKGIPREDLDRVFERFYRAAGVGGEGTGLGLAIARDILRLHGCQIRADSEAGKGSAFSFTLPLETRGKAELAPRLAGADKDGD